MTRSSGLCKDVGSSSGGIQPEDYRRVSVGILLFFFPLFLFYFILIGVSLVYSVVLVSGMHQNESVLHIHGLHRWCLPV